MTTQRNSVTQMGFMKIQNCFNSKITEENRTSGNVMEFNEYTKLSPGLPVEGAEKSQLSLTKSEPIIISPAGVDPAKKGLYLLSNLDQICVYPIEILFAYEKINHDIDASKILKKSLSVVLEKYYPLAGGVDVSWDGRLVVDCGGGKGGVPFIEAVSDEEMAVVAGNIAITKPKFMSFMYSSSVEPYKTILDVPPLSVQVTRFSCGGIILGVGFNHLLMDGQGFADFMSSWSQIARGLPLSSINPHLDRSIFSARRPLQIQSSHPEYSRSKAPLIPIYERKQITINKYFVFTPTKISRLRKLAMQKNNNDNNNFVPTSFEIISTVVWICWTKALKIDKGKITQLITAIDGRPKFNPPIPKSYFGNVLTWSCARSKVFDLTSRQFAHAVQIVHEAIGEVTEDHVRSEIDYFEFMRKPIEHENSLWITKWSRLPFYDVDFAWGNPTQVAPAGVLDNLVVSLSEWNGSQNLVISLNLPCEAMEIFQEVMETEFY